MVDMLMHETTLWEEPTIGALSQWVRLSGWTEAPLIPVQCMQAPPLERNVVAKDAQSLKYKCLMDTNMDNVGSRVPVSDLTYIRVRSGIIVLRA